MNANSSQTRLILGQLILRNKKDAVLFFNNFPQYRKSPKLIADHMFSPDHSNMFYYCANLPQKYPASFDGMMYMVHNDSIFYCVRWKYGK